MQFQIKRSERNQEWFWHLKADNGEILATSETMKNHRDCHDIVFKIQRELRGASVDDSQWRAEQDVEHFAEHQAFEPEGDAQIGQPIDLSERANLSVEVEAMRVLFTVDFPTPPGMNATATNNLCRAIVHALNDKGMLQAKAGPTDG